MEHLEVYAAPLPFSDRQIKVLALPGSTIQEIVDNVIPERLANACGARVEISGHKIPRKHWSRVRPKEGSITIVRVVPMGGGGKKNPLASILSIAIMVAAPYAVAGLGYTSLGVSANALTLAGRAVAAGLGMVGTMLVNAIAPPPKPSNIGSQVSNPSESPTQFIEGASNKLNPYGVIPICLGTNRVFPNKGAKTYTESIDSAQYCRDLFVWSYGPVVLDQFKIGDTDLDEFDNVEIEHKLDADLDSGVTLYSDDVSQDDYNVLLRQVDGYTVRTSAPETDELIVDVTFPQGLSQFDTNGARVAMKVQLELQYAQSGVSPQVWSPAATAYKAFSGLTLTPAADMPPNQNQVGGFSGSFVAYRRDIAVVNNLTGIISLVKGSGQVLTAALALEPALPANSIRLATVLVKTTRPYSGYTLTNTIETMSDDRAPALVGTTLQNSSSFVPTVVGATLQISTGGLLFNPLDLTGAQGEALRKSVTITLPSRGQYDVRVRRLTTDSVSDRIFDKVYLTAVRSVAFRNPWIQPDVSGSALRIKATDQLNGVVDMFNAICSTLIPDYDAGTDSWIVRATSNPASIYRYVLQGPANAKPLPDAQVNIEDLEAWHTQCAVRGYSYNRVIDYETSVLEVLADVAAAGAASPAIIDGKRTVVVDLEKPDIVQVVTPRNSWNYSGTMTYPNLPHALRVSFRNPGRGYQQDELIVFNDGYDETNATIYEQMELVSCTNSDLAYKTASRHFATARLRPETHTFMMDVEGMVALRGQRIKFASDVPQIGVGDGRIKSLILSGTSPQTVLGITLDDTIGIPAAGDYYVRIRLADMTSLYTSITESTGYTQTLTFRTPLALASAPAVGDLCYVVEAGKETDLIISRIEPQSDLSVRITALNYAPEIFDAELAPIPPFQSNLSSPLELMRPAPPVLVNITSDESAMVRSSDGSIMSRMVIDLRNDNESDMEVAVSIRASGSSVYTTANVLQASPQRVVLAGLQDAIYYDVSILYRRPGGRVLSLPLLINSYKFIGASGTPGDVVGYEIAIVGDQANHSWEPSTDIDHHHSEIRFTSTAAGLATWETSQVLIPIAQTNHITTALQRGTYLIKHVDIAGNYSATATLVETVSYGNLRNVVQTYNEEPTFAGTKVNTAASGGSLKLADDAISVGYYYFQNTLDLGAVYPSFLSASLIANGTYINNLYSYSDLFAVADLYGETTGFDLFGIDDLFAETDLFGIGEGAWKAELFYRTTQGSTGVSPVAWSDWIPFTAGSVLFRGIQFMAVLTSLRANVSPEITKLEVTIDMPDRVIADNNLAVGTSGLRVDFDPVFLYLDGLAIAAQGLASGDYYTFGAKDETGFEIYFWNSSNAAVARSFDYVAKGYGQLVP